MADRAVNAGYKLSGTVEAPLAGYVCSEQEEDDQLENVINALNERHKRGGFLSDEFSPAFIQPAWLLSHYLLISMIEMRWVIRVAMPSNGCSTRVATRSVSAGLTAVGTAIRLRRGGSESNQADRGVSLSSRGVSRRRAGFDLGFDADCGHPTRPARGNYTNRR
jgi:hypothetical protein